MNKLDSEQFGLFEDDELMTRYIELKAAILEETKSRGGLFVDRTVGSEETYSVSYLQYYGVS